MFFHLYRHSCRHALGSWQNLNVYKLFKPLQTQGASKGSERDATISSCWVDLVDPCRLRGTVLGSAEPTLVAAALQPHLYTQSADLGMPATWYQTVVLASCWLGVAKSTP